MSLVERLLTDLRTAVDLISAFGSDADLGSALSDGRCHVAVKIHHLAVSAADQTVTWSHMVEDLRRVAQQLA